jgi:hypothetical protein
MKRALIGLLTFTLGVSASSIASLWTPIQSVEPPGTIELQPLDVPEQNVRRNAGGRFFDSFEDDDYFYGWFIPNRFRGMGEVWTIYLSKDIGEDNNIDGWTVLILTSNPDGSSNDADNFHATVLKVSGTQLRFRTNSIRGVNYGFDGAFLRTGHVFTQEEKVSRGTMRKFVRGRLKAQFTADFAYAEPHCFH